MHEEQHADGGDGGPDPEPGRVSMRGARSGGDVRWPGMGRGLGQGAHGDAGERLADGLTYGIPGSPPSPEGETVTKRGNAGTKR